MIAYHVRILPPEIPGLPDSQYDWTLVQYLPEFSGEEIIYRSYMGQQEDI